jgi:hypothetical protein
LLPVEEAEVETLAEAEAREVFVQQSQQQVVEVL